MNGNTPTILLICGSGGVGKTTVSAALGLKFASEGKKTIVLTIDPARRLADSLGIAELDDTPKKIATNLQFKNGGEMWAMMLDTKRTFDRLVEKYAPSPAVKEKIFGNKIYQHLSQMLAGSQEYMAMERLYEIRQQGLHEVIIVDTPPMQNAIEFLEAPDKLSNMITNSMLHLLLKPSLALGRAGFKFFEKGSQQILKIFDRIIGFAFLQDISEMIIAFQGLLDGFNSRAREVRALLQEDNTHFIVVCTTSENSVAETAPFAAKLREMNYRLGKIIVNRVYPGKSLTQAKITEDKKSLQKLFSGKEAEILAENYQTHLGLIKRDGKKIAALSELVGKNNVHTIPLFLSDIHDINGLLQIATHLTGDF